MRTVSYIILGIMFLVYLTPANNFNTSNEAINYLLRSFYHANIQHIVANAISFYSLSFIEDVMGSTSFIIMMVFLWIVSSMLLYIYHLIFPSRKVYTVGFSGIVFGMMVVYLSLMGQSPLIGITGLVISILPQLFVPGISHEGHICGIIAGAIYILLFPTKKYMNNMPNAKN